MRRLLVVEIDADDAHCGECEHLQSGVTEAYCRLFDERVKTTRDGWARDRACRRAEARSVDR